MKVINNITAKEEASKLFLSYYQIVPAEAIRFISLTRIATEMAIHCVDKIIYALKGNDIFNAYNIEYWQEVKEELKKQ